MKTKKATGGTVARQKERQTVAYRTALPLSSLKVLIGGLLLFGNKSQKAFWPLFDAALRQYVDLKLVRQSAPEGRETTNAGLGASG